VAGAWLLANYDWRTAWALSGWFVLLVILPVIMIQLWGHGDRHRRYEARLEELTEGPREIRVRQWTLPEVLKDVRFWLIQPALVSAPSIIFSIQFHQLYIVDSKGWALSTYASSYMVYAVTSLLATLVAGVVIDRYGSRPLINTYLWPLVPALLLLGLFDHPAVILALMVLTGLCFGLGLVVFVTLWAEMYGTRHMGAIRSFNVFFNVLCASAVMVVTGWLIDNEVSIAAMSYGGIAFVTVSLVMFAIERRIKVT
jgi:MFS family permease